MSTKQRLAKLEAVHSRPAETWLRELLAELAAARNEGREPMPRRATNKEQADLIQNLPEWGLNLKVFDDGTNEW
ncbi:hypothetical protein [Oceanisphaera pacifica]|uniref:Uncharacterized protein n=1 Tax=Oceanisphaera pacifica TaxID=2818389 RepID=A0ABS3NJZ4_9GAMM|nr:hypothetical protein [Oceanisphaera pacifica]MBO1520637.1 hypothetical protein [Oceanisphaera pacifica]